MQYEPAMQRPPDDGDPPGPDARLYAPATTRNRQPILEVLRRVLSNGGRVLEVASGTGEHVAWFARALPAIEWQPSVPDPVLRASIAAHAGGAGNVAPPLDLDCARLPWPRLDADAVVCVNLTHIAPWAATTGLLEGSASLLGAGGVLYIYGPFKRAGRHTAPSNAAFDEALRRHDPRWGVRDLDEIARHAGGCNLDLEEVVDMPSNNLSAIFRKR
jgi:hypothetical protein